LEARAHIRLQREIDRRHAAGDLPDPASVGFIAFMAHFETRYRLAPLDPGSRILAIAAGIGAHGLWSVSHGLARGLEIRGEYKRMMDHAAMPRQGDLDGRGNLSHRALTGLFAFDTLVDRLRLYAERHAWRSEAWLLLERALQQGEVPRGDAARITGLRERSARDLLATLIADGLPLCAFRCMRASCCSPACSRRHDVA
jgi:hypothetical protein